MLVARRGDRLEALKQELQAQYKVHLWPYAVHLRLQYPACVLAVVFLEQLQCCRQTECHRKGSVCAYQEQGLAQVDVHNVVADLSVTSQVEALAADLPPAFREVRRSP